MLVRKWNRRQMAAGLLVIALLVLGGVNLTGLLQGENAINQAESVKFLRKVISRETAFTPDDPGDPLSPGTKKCGGLGLFCL